MTALELAAQARELAADIQSSIDAHVKYFGAYVRDGYSSAIIEHQLNRRNVGEEPRMLKEAADALESLHAENERLRDGQRELCEELLRKPPDPPSSHPHEGLTCAETEVALEHQHKELERLRAIEAQAKSNLAFIRDAADQRLRAENDWNMSNVFRFAKRAVEEMESAGKAGEAESG